MTERSRDEWPHCSTELHCTPPHWMDLAGSKGKQPPRCFPVKYVVSFFRVLNFASSSFASVSQPSQLSQDAMVLLIVGACKLEENSHRTTNQTSTEIYGHSLCDLFWRLHWMAIRPRALITTTHHSRCIVVESLLYGHTTMLTNGSGCRRVVVADKSPGFSHSAPWWFVYFRWLSYWLATGKLASSHWINARTEWGNDMQWDNNYKEHLREVDHSKDEIESNVINWYGTILLRKLLKRKIIFFVIVGGIKYWGNYFKIFKYES